MGTDTGDSRKSGVTSARVRKRSPVLPKENAEFPLHHGRVALAFAGTVGDRASVPVERIPDAAAFERWLVAAGLAVAGAASGAAEVRDEAVVLREAIARIAKAFVDGTRPAARDLATLNRFAAEYGTTQRLDPKTLRLAYAKVVTPARAALGRLANDAIDLFGTDARRGLRRCDLDACGAIFVDLGTGRPRRWCSMERCGNRAKVAAFRERREGAQ